MGNLIVACDVGTSGVKSCLYDVGDTIELVASASASYGLSIDEGGRAEQDPQELWDALCDTTRQIRAEADVDWTHLRGISFCSQMQSLVLVDEDGDPVRPTMSYMD